MKFAVRLLLLGSVCLLFGCKKVETANRVASCISGKVAYTRYLDSQNNIYLLDLKSGKESLLYNAPHASGIGAVRWSPDGKSIAFPLYSGENSDIFVLTLGESVPRQITDTPYIELRPAWSPDGTEMIATTVIDKYGQIIKFRTDELSEAVQITKGKWNFDQPSWSSDGKNIVYISSKDIPSGIYIMNSDGSNQTLLSKDISGYIPAWSPDGKYIAFESKSLSSRWRIVLYHTKDGEFTLLIPNNTGEAEDEKYSIGGPIWSKNGKCVLFIKGKESDEFLYVMDFSSREIMEVINIGLTNSIDWYSE
jgi:Tol biopolymer transport system component